MQTYLAVLRGINVSGQKTIKMSDLRALFEKAGFEKVQTFIQSGNVIFQTKETKTKALAQKIEEIIHHHYNFDVSVIVLTREEILTIMVNNPFTRGNKDITKFHVTLLAETPNAKLLETTRDEKFQSDEFHIDERAIYLYCPDGYGMTRFSNNFFEKKLGVSATTRNWKTMNTLLELMQNTEK